VFACGPAYQGLFEVQLLFETEPLLMLPILVENELKEKKARELL